MGAKEQTEKAVDLALASRLDTLIKEHPKTAEQIAEDFGVSPSAVWKWRNQGHISKARLIELGDYFGCSLDWLLRGQPAWGETPERRAWIETIESMSADDQQRLRRFRDALTLTTTDPTGTDV